MPIQYLAVQLAQHLLLILPFCYS